MLCLILAGQTRAGVLTPQEAARFISAPLWLEVMDIVHELNTGKPSEDLTRAAEMLLKAAGFKVIYDGQRPGATAPKPPTDAEIEASHAEDAANNPDPFEPQ
jgi:hypothetical protein